MEKGVLYKATGSYYLREAVYSANRVKTVMPEIPTAIVTDRGNDLDNFDHIIHQNNLEKDVSSSILSPLDSPFEKTLFLDTDTYMYKPVPELFDLLNDNDMSACHSSRPTPGLGEGYNLFNSGVILYRTNEKVTRLFENWFDIYWDMRKKQGVISNQPSFSRSIYESDCDIHVLPKWYNTSITRGALGHDAKIIHDRPLHTMRDGAEYLNKTERFRVYYSDPSLFGKKKINMYTIPASNKEDPVYKRVITSIKCNGIRYTFKAILFDVFSSIYSRKHLKRTKID